MYLKGRPPVRVLVTGFGPFPGVEQNASASVVRALALSGALPGIELFAEVIPVEWTQARAAARHAIAKHAASCHSAFRRGKARHRLRDRDPRRQHERAEAGSGGGCPARPEACPLRGARSATGAAARHPPPGAPAGWLSRATFQKCRALPLQRALLLEPHGRRRHRRAGKLHSFAGDWHRARAQDLPHA